MAAAALVRHRRELAARRALAARHGWQIHGGPERELRARLGGAALMQLGHSRRVRNAFGARGRILLIHYVFETGFEDRRRSHHWLMAVGEIEHACSRATITRYDWLTIAAAGPAWRKLTVTPPGQPESGAGALAAVVEDAEEWRLRLDDLRTWLFAQPPTRSWETLPGCVIGYEPGRFDEQRLVALESACRDFMARLSAKAGS